MLPRGDGCVHYRVSSVNTTDYARHRVPWHRLSSSQVNGNSGDVLDRLQGNGVVVPTHAEDQALSRGYTVNSLISRNTLIGPALREYSPSLKDIWLTGSSWDGYMGRVSKS